MTNVLHIFRSMPRAARWLVAFGAVVIGYFVAVQPAIDAILIMNGRAAGARGELGHEGRERAAREQAVVLVRSGMGVFGTVSFPGEPAERSEAFNRRINEVLFKHDVKGDRRVTRTAPLEPGPMDAAAGPSKRIDRLIMDIQFEASPEQVSAVLADLESAPEVAAVSRVQLRRESGGEGGAAPGRTLRVNLSAEAWLLSRKEGGR
jgi:hypothetical protein